MDIIRFFKDIPRTDCQRNGIFLLIQLCVFAMVFYIIGVKDYWMDVNHYWNNINSFLVYHQMPYRDYVFEYPPFTLVIFLIPRLFSQTVGDFHYAFGIFAMLSYMAASLVLFNCFGKTKRTRILIAVLLILIPVFSFKFIITRNDTFAMALVIIALWLFKKDYLKTAMVLLSLATMIKIYPILFIGVIFIWLLAQRDTRSAFISLAVSVVTCLLCQLPFIISDPSTAFSYLSYHSDRGIQIESVVATFMYIAYFCGLTDLYYIESYGSDNMWGTLPDMVAPHMNTLLIASVLILAAVVLYREYVHYSETGERNETLLPVVMLAMVLAFITFSKVYSAQYMLWIFGLLPFLLLLFEDRDEQLLLFALILAFGASSCIASYFYTSYDIYLWFAVLEGVKNAFTVALLAYSIMLIRRRTGNTPAEG